MNNIEGVLPYNDYKYTPKQIITIPYLFTPRTYQKELMAAIDTGYKRAILVYHRRAG